MKKIIKKIAYTVLLSTCAIVTVFVLLVYIGFAYTEYIEGDDREAARPKTGMYVPTADTKMFVQKTGTVTAPAVIFMHGTGAWREIWRPYMDQVTVLELV
ncbi:alpha/beta fold hydrolase [Chitinimonas sp. BJB300]|uniref:alpha/beta fold hydrolase n=1 Tax=Chitinimonas sp. BJB300 TaxID=1559339 RepID=UPI000C0DE626|nr:hypothetical protein [Chitinimonas sp. BJB300]PHV10686.1 hypothetical protein CSQ89_14865 [Chitinimonas sp. BJB300]TSJ90766.1 hypothetical protein FG002_000115 [Chitinimonas sp. BJB300]